MAGLLGLSQDPETLGLLQLAANIGAASGPSLRPVNPMAGVASGLSAMDETQNNAVKRRLLQAQIQDIANQAALRELQMRQITQGMGLADLLMGAGQQPGGTRAPAQGFTPGQTIDDPSAGMTRLVTLPQFSEAPAQPQSSGAQALGGMDRTTAAALLNPVTAKLGEAMVSLQSKGVKYEDAGDSLVPVSVFTGQRVAGLPAIPKGIAPGDAATLQQRIYEWNNPSAYQRGELANQNARTYFETGMGGGPSAAVAAPAQPAVTGSSDLLSRLPAAQAAAILRSMQIEGGGTFNLNLTGANGEPVQGQVTSGPAPISSVPPPGMTPKQFSESQGRALDEANKNAIELKKGIDSSVELGASLNMRLREMQSLLTQFQTGGGKTARAELARYAQAIPGMPQRVVDGIAGGSLAASQEFHKLALQSAIEQLKQSLNAGGTGPGRVLQIEFDTFLKANPNLDTDPRAVEKIFAFNNRMWKYSMAQQGAYDDFTRAGNQPKDFPGYWAFKAQQMQLTNPNMTFGPEDAGPAGAGSDLQSRARAELARRGVQLGGAGGAW